MKFLKMMPFVSSIAAITNAAKASGSHVRAVCSGRQGSYCRKGNRSRPDAAPLCHDDGIIAASCETVSTVTIQYTYGLNRSSMMTGCSRGAGLINTTGSVSREFANPAGSEYLVGFQTRSY